MNLSNKSNNPITSEIESSVNVTFTWDSTVWKVVATIIFLFSFVILGKTILNTLNQGNGINRGQKSASKAIKGSGVGRYGLKIPFTGAAGRPIVSKFWREVADYQTIGAIFVTIVAGYGYSMSYEQVDQFLGLFIADFLSYWNYYFPTANKAPSLSVAANLVDVASAQIKDSGPSEVQEVKSGLSPNAKIYIAVYVVVAIVCFVATGYFPF